ncbi:TPA: hypothetical protein ACF5HI_004616 [Salmonella enterica]
MNANENDLIIEINISNDNFKDNYDAPEYDKEANELRWFKKSGLIVKLILKEIYHSNNCYAYNVDFWYGDVWEWAVDRTDGLGYQTIRNGKATLKLNILDDGCQSSANCECAWNGKNYCINF